jgi:putative hemolysin
MKNKLIDYKELRQMLKLPPFPGNCISKLFMSVLKLNKLNEAYNQTYSEDPLQMIDNLFELRGNKIDIIQRELDRIPKTGPFIIVCNHPYGGWDGISLLKTLLPIRQDIKILSNFMLRRIEPLKSYFLPVNPFETHKKAQSSFSGLKQMHQHLAQGHPLIFFPSGEVATRYKGMDRVTDKTWQANILKFIYKANVPVISVFIKGQNSFFFHFLGKIHPLLRTLRLPQEMIRFSNKTIRIRIGLATSPKTTEEFNNSQLYGSYIRAKTFALDIGFTSDFSENIMESVLEIIEPTSKELLLNEINTIHATSYLFEFEQYVCYCASKKDIPNIYRELTRLREITFREVGEGTGKSADSDKYDAYYHHLFIWDKEALQLVGAYRIGFGKEIYQNYGIKGFYVHSLFKLRSNFAPYLIQSLELGRSFVTKEYQKKTNSLFMLWKGILYVLLKNPEYRYLIGPVSISNLYAHTSKVLLIDFFKNNYGDKDLSKMVKPRLEFKYTLNQNQKLLLNYCNNDLRKMDKLMEDIDPNGMRIPVLIKKYVAQGGKLLCFNIDPDFNYAIDGFVISDIKDIPEAHLKLLAKEIDDPELLNRFSE